MVGVAVKVTEVPAQMVVAEAETLKLTGRFGFTVIVNWFEDAGLPVAQVALEVSWHLTWSLLTSELLEKVVALVPTFEPFTIH